MTRPQILLDFSNVKHRELDRALREVDVPAIYFLEQELHFFPTTSFVPNPNSNDHSQARFRDLNRAIISNDHESARLCLWQYPSFRQTLNQHGESLGHLVCRALGADKEMAGIVVDSNFILLTKLEIRLCI